MEEKAVELLATLAAKLGTTIELLWAVLLKQAYINGLISVITVLIGVPVAVWWIRVVMRKTRRDDESPWDEFGTALGWISVFITVGVGFLIFQSCLSDAITALANPEYWAFKQITKLK